MTISISKRDLWHYVNRKVKRLIHHYHVFAIISILFDEMIQDLKAGKEIKITNLGILVLKEMPPRKYHNVRLRCVMEAPGHRVLRLFLSKPIRKKLCESLDIK
ncbi:MAG TPA: HU family DNA-binding protein [Candidatus Saccharimonadales bacterium]